MRRLQETRRGLRLEIVWNDAWQSVWWRGSDLLTFSTTISDLLLSCRISVLSRLLFARFALTLLFSFLFRGLTLFLFFAFGFLSPLLLLLLFSLPALSFSLTFPFFLEPSLLLGFFASTLFLLCLSFSFSFLPLLFAL
jgi:hypothetical protein